MQRTLIIIFLFLTTTVYGKKWENRAFRNYYLFINKAELCIIDGKLPEASNFYDSAFATSYMFPVDLYNAFRVNFNINNTTKSLKTYRQLVLFGMDKDKFSLGFNQFTDTIPLFYRYVESYYDSFKSEIKYQEMFKFYSAFLDELFELDQSSRRLGGDSAIIAGDSLLERRFLDFAAKSGIPEFQYAGLLEKTRPQPFNPGVLDLIMFHRRGAKNSIFLNVIYENMLVGKVDARTYMLRYFCNNCEGREYYINIPIEPITKKQLEYSDSIRKEIYLEPLQDYYKKIVYHRSQKNKLEYVLVNEFCRLFNGDNELRIKEDSDPK